MDNISNIMKGRVSNSPSRSSSQLTLCQILQEDFTMQGADNKDDTIRLLNEVAVAIAITNDDAVAKVFRRTNERIYAAILGFDNLIKDLEKCTNSPTIAKPKDQDSWASAYKSFMIDTLTTQNAAIKTWITDVINSKNYVTKNKGNKSTNVVSLEPLTTKDAAGNEVDTSIGKALKAFKAAYPESSWAFDADKLLSWPEDTTALKIGDSCTAKSSTGTASSIVSSSTSASSEASSSIVSTKGLTTTTAVPTTSASTTVPPTSTSSTTSSSTLQCSSDTEYSFSRSEAIEHVKSYCKSKISLTKKQAKHSSIYKMDAMDGGALKISLDQDFTGACEDVDGITIKKGYYDYMGTSSSCETTFQSLLDSCKSSIPLELVVYTSKRTD